MAAAAGLLARFTMASAEAMARLGFEKLALRGATLTYGIQYFRGVREEAGSLRAALRGMRNHLRQH